MFHSFNWLRWLSQKSPAKPIVRRLTRRRLELELLEDRLAPAVVQFDLSTFRVEENQG
jgi:hypothetical protein